MLGAGIERILPPVDQPAAQLPDARGLVPGESPYTRQLDEIIRPQSIEEQIVDSFRSEIENRALLTPNGYQAAHDASRRELAELASTLRDGVKIEKLRKALAVLDQEADLRAGRRVVRCAFRAQRSQDLRASRTLVPLMSDLSGTLARA